MDYHTKYLKYKEKYLKMKGGNQTIIRKTIINVDALREAWELYERYVMLKLCINKVNIDDELWLPVEIWDIIVNMMKNDIESMNIYDSNPYYEKLTLKLLNKYKKDKLGDTIEQDSNISLCTTI